MTDKEWNDILIRVKSERKPIQVNWIELYPPSIKFIQNPSEFMKESPRMRGYISFYPEKESIVIREDGLSAKSRRYIGDELIPKLNIHYRHIQKIRITWRN